MTQAEIQEIVAKYRQMSHQELEYGEEKCALYERIADQLEQDIDLYVDDECFQSEKEIIDDIIELFNDYDKYFNDDDWEAGWLEHKLENHTRNYQFDYKKANCYQTDFNYVALD